MTWGEFKKVLEERGVKDDHEIWFIDISFPEAKRPDDITVGLPASSNAGLSVY